jgi:hypothetical protein
MLTAATTACAALLPIAGAQATTSPMSPCDNEVNGPTNVLLPGGLGNIEIQLGDHDDVFVQYDGPGTPLDTLVGADVQTISLADYSAVCVVLPVAGGVMVAVNVVGLDVDVCTYNGQPYSVPNCLI